jgi:hypothetical protein
MGRCMPVLWARMSPLGSDTRAKLVGPDAPSLTSQSLFFAGDTHPLKRIAVNLRRRGLGELLTPFC